MSAFLTRLLIEALPADEVTKAKSDRQLYWVQREFQYRSDRFGLITVPVGFQTDFASIPRAAWAWMSPEDPVILYPSLIHDYLYNSALLSRAQADLVLREAMALCGARWDQRQIVYGAVRTFGGPNFHNQLAA